MAIILAKGNIEEEIQKKKHVPINAKVLQAIGLADKIHDGLDCSLAALNWSNHTDIPDLPSTDDPSINNDLDQLLAILRANAKMIDELKTILYADEETDIHAE